MDNLKKFNDFLNEAKVETKSLLDAEVGDEVWCGGSSGFCRSGNRTITRILKRYDEKTGKPYKVICLDDRKFDSRDGSAMTPPWAYHIRAI